jgi:hypothetical protein
MLSGRSGTARQLYSANGYSGRMDARLPPRPTGEPGFRHKRARYPSPRNRFDRFLPTLTKERGAANTTAITTASTSALPLYASAQQSNHPPSRTTAGPLPGAD